MPLEIGKFIAKLRKEKGLTQEQFGKIIGVTNKTVSRWETGIYLPPADAMLVMSELFDISINEILSGKKLTVEEYKKAAEKNLMQTIKASSFSLKDKIVFYKKKWLKEHIADMVLIAICIIGVFVTGIVFKKEVLVCAAMLMFVLGHCWRNNTMMSYVENHAYDSLGNKY